MKNIYITFVFIFITSTLFSQSPWTREKGKFFTNISFSSISDYNEIFGNPDYTTERFITDRTYQIYTEYGLSNKSNIFINIPLKSIETGDLSSGVNAITNAGSETALGNIALGYKYNFYNKGTILSGQLTTEFNTSSYDAVSGIRTGFDAVTFTPLFLAGKSFGKNYVQSFIGADIRTNGYSSNFKIGGEYGRKITQNIWLIGILDISTSLNNGDILLPQQNLETALYANNQEYAAYGVKGVLQFCDFGITAAVGSAFAGNNVPKATAISFGIFNTF